jgi:sigma-B regulation protein RsbU (phosphoserine phosphatase)
MQESLLPQPLAVDTLRPFGLSLHAVNLPAAEVAGDFFDHFIDARGRLVVCIADVSGKGASAAMLMAVTRTALRGAADGADGPADIVRSINRFLLENTHDTVSFVTMIVLFIHRDGTMAYSNAGHPPAICLCDQRAPLDIAPGTGTVVGIVPEDEAPAGQALLTLPADWTRLVFVTDGVLEAAQASARHATAQPREMFGLARLHTLLASHSRAPASEICDAIVRAVQTFEGANRGDDVTVLVIARESTP